MKFRSDFHIDMKKKKKKKKNADGLNKNVTSFSDRRWRYFRVYLLITEKKGSQNSIYMFSFTCLFAHIYYIFAF